MTTRPAPLDGGAGYLIEHFGRERRLDRITRADLEEWIAWLARRKLADPTPAQARTLRRPRPNGHGRLSPPE